MQMKVKESSIVKPAKETPKHTLKSSNLDLLVPSFHAPTIYFYKPDGSNGFFDTHLLKEALSNCLVIFYPVAGRLKRREEGCSGGFDVDCNGEGVLFVEAESGGVMDDFGDFTPCFDLQQLIPTSDESFSLPILMLQVAYFKCGGAFLGVGFQHTLVDGMSALSFINTWSDMTCGLSITISPFIDRSLLSGRDQPSRTYHHIEYDSPPSMNNPIVTQEYQTSPKLTSTAVIKITRDQLTTLKVNSKDDENPERYNTYETLAAHVWRCSCIARGLGEDQATKLYISTDGRSRLHPPLPPGYFGNVIFTAISLALSGDLRSKPLNSTVTKIHDDALSRMDDDYLRSALDYHALQPDPTALVRGAHTFKCPNLNVVSWIRLPVYDADFGWGRPIHMGPADVPFEGNVYILPSPTGDGSLSLVICLEADHMTVFKTVFYDY
ncbi:hypothetical protein RHSIM_Rhsim01G0027900 [Rhododendron simsii]|uniref:Uncharacterized protein n=1 Tax=Rhododendron simsii TaxID=118357 RepID=A0A834LX23_RHOSS|nr:hypothetical protein RHSIM_Rhsim01G0027900 [Rhododendron simsii]